jgi:radial spoke head protein 9
MCVTGIECDYYIAVGTNCHGQIGFPQRRFFWCTSQNYVFSEMPEARMSA